MQSTSPSYPLGARHNFPRILNIIDYMLRISSEHHISTHEGHSSYDLSLKAYGMYWGCYYTLHLNSWRVFTPKLPFRTYNRFIHSFKCECVCTCEHTLHISFISFTFHLYNLRPSFITSHTLHTSYNHISPLYIILNILLITSFIKHLTRISSFKHNL